MIVSPSHTVTRVPVKVLIPLTVGAFLLALWLVSLVGGSSQKTEYTMASMTDELTPWNSKVPLNNVIGGANITIDGHTNRNFVEFTIGQSSYVVTVGKENRMIQFRTFQWREPNEIILNTLPQKVTIEIPVHSLLFGAGS